MGRFTVEPWAREWLEAQREKGEACLEVKVSNGNHYVYRSTTSYDKGRKGPVKVSEYIGTLNKDSGLVRRKAVRRPSPAPLRVTVKETGPMRLLYKAAGPLPPVLEVQFPGQWRSILGLSMLRCLREVPFDKASSVWDKHDDPAGICPALSPSLLSDLVGAVGLDREAQNEVFKAIEMDGAEMAFDLSEFFSSSDSLPFAERGFGGADHDLPMIGIALACSLGTGRPLSIRPLPGSTGDVSSLASAFREMGRHGVLAVMDKAFYSEENVRILRGEGVSYILPLRRNSLRYGNVVLGEYDTFEYRGRLIRYGWAPAEDGCLYLFRDESMRAAEERTVFGKYRAGELDMEEVETKKRTMGTILMISDRTMPPEEVYLAYKRRDKVEKMFRTYFDVLRADSSYVNDAGGAFGHVFVSFLSLYIMSGIEDALRRAGLLSGMSARDVLFEYSKAYVLVSNDGRIDYEIPKRLRELDEKLGFNIFPIIGS